jgi:predicted Zn-dependent protease
MKTYGPLLILLAALMGGMPAIPLIPGEELALEKQDVNNALSEMNRDLSLQGDDISPVDEYYIGRAVGANILAKYKPFENREFSAYLNKICWALALHAGAASFNGYQVMILDSPELNAFATPGGHIFISRGLAETAASEDMLAALIAHEIAHIALRHSTGMIRAERFQRDLGEVAKKAEKTALRGTPPEEKRRLFDDSVRAVADTLTLTGFSWEQEFEADAQAVLLLASAGYDPSSLIALLQVLESTPGNGGFGSHPPAALRISRVEGIVKNYTPQNTRSFRAARFDAQRSIISP